MRFRSHKLEIEGRYLWEIYLWNSVVCSAVCYIWSNQSEEKFYEFTRGTASFVVSRSWSSSIGIVGGRRRNSAPLRCSSNKLLTRHFYAPVLEPFQSSVACLLHSGRRFRYSLSVVSWKKKYSLKFSGKLSSSCVTWLCDSVLTTSLLILYLC